MDKSDPIRDKNSCFLVGVTGGIASGKTTVTHMLRGMGVPLIDYDVLARQVVEPGQPAWKEIIGYFGNQILQTNDEIDRKKLSKIVFKDLEKRKTLESFTHPFIHKEFVRQLDEMTGKTPGAIIQVSIPLMIEQNLQSMFHKIVVVYISEEKQIERLVARDKISKKEALAILAAQLPIDEKITYADFVIYNEGPLEETQKQVVDLWNKLKDIEKEISEKD